MKRKLLTLIPITAALLATTGCVNLSKLVIALSKDPAALRLQLTTIHGTLNLSRAGANTNSVKITNEGEIINNPQTSQANTQPLE